MKFDTSWITSVTCAAAVLASGAPALAQEPAQNRTPETREFVFERKLPADVTVAVTPGDHVPAAIARGGETAVFVSSEMGIDGKVVKGAPYSAEMTTEMVQTLADGNRIVRKSTGTIARDSEGRTRREQSIGAFGPWGSATEPPRITAINDPVASVHYILDAKNQTARKLPVFTLVEGDKFKVKEKEKMKAEVKVKKEKEAAVASFGGDVILERVPGPGAPARAGEVRVFSRGGEMQPGKTESLGTQTIEGVEAEGTRTTFTIEAGKIGNESPINIVSESWYSPALQTVVLSKHSDPRFGETTFRLTNIDRSEPARTLFEVPSGYTVVDDRPGAGRFQIRRSENE